MQICNEFSYLHDRCKMHKASALSHLQPFLVHLFVSISTGDVGSHESELTVEEQPHRLLLSRFELTTSTLPPVPSAVLMLLRKQRERN
jgi:hypothetical protein